MFFCQALRRGRRGGTEGCPGRAVLGIACPVQGGDTGDPTAATLRGWQGDREEMGLVLGNRSVIATGICVGLSKTL